VRLLKKRDKDIRSGPRESAEHVLLRSGEKIGTKEKPRRRGREGIETITRNHEYEEKESRARGNRPKSS